LLKRLLLIIPVLFISSWIFGQRIQIQVDQEPLSQLFYEIRDQYQIQFTFNSKDLEGLLVTKSATYNTAEEAISDIISGFDLAYEKRGNIFVITPNKLAKTEEPKKKKQPDYHYYSGFIADASVGESLPAAVVKYNNGILTSDASGFFNFKSPDSLVNVQIQYLGYFTKDTLLSPSKLCQINMQSADYYLNEVEVKTIVPVFDMISGQEAGKIKLNQKTSRYLPGNMDNGIYNMLRLQPGIMATGEQSDDYTIWGSWPGQNIVEYDHIKLFNISSFDDNQSIVHPLMVKEIDVTKGGFGADYGNGVGGLVNILGKNGDYKNFHGNANINNQAVSGYLNIPLADQLSFQTAYRQTFYNILNQDSETQFEKANQKYFIPETNFRDFNVKFSGETKKKDQFYINVLASEDNQNYNYSIERMHGAIFTASNDKTKTQVGASAEFNKFYNKGIHSNTVLSYSNLNYDINFNRSNTGSVNGHNDFNFNSVTANNISEFKFSHGFNFILGKKNSLSVSGEYVRNANSYRNEIDYTVAKEFEHESNRLGLILKDDISLFGKLFIQAGLRTEFIPGRSQVYLQPRVNLSYDLLDHLKLNAAYGKYYQYLFKSTIFNDKDVLFTFWEIMDTERRNPTSAQHYVLGLSWDHSFFQLNIEGFYKNIRDITNYKFDLPNREFERSLGDGKVSGVDFYLKTKFRKHEFWLAYTLSQTLEHFEFFESDEFELAPHNQTHELKGAAILNFSPFYFSANYVYGSGLQFTSTLEDRSLIPYNRLDASLMYKINIQKVYCQFGISALNIFDTHNIKYNNLIRLPDDELVYSQTTPFTLLLNIYIGF